ncbi:MAG: PIN domain-containing protein [Candidatus Hydrogenedentes bacterium]|nr:PIN domain-containing protein [Candidatus Hydrogenedentota bacterium]
MRAVFADTSFYVALANPRDSLHSAALEFSQGFRGRTVTSEFVLVEVGNFFSSTETRQLFVDLFSQLRSDSYTQIVECSTKLLSDAVELFAIRNDKRWSLTDCTSFAVMNTLHLKSALTADHHFAQAGFEVLLA